MLTSHPQTRDRCRVCGLDLPAWLPVAKRPEASMRLYHLGQQHMDQLKPYLTRMETACIDTILTTELSELVEGDETR